MEITFTDFSRACVFYGSWSIFHLRLLSPFSCLYTRERKKSSEVLPVSYCQKLNWSRGLRVYLWGNSVFVQWKWWNSAVIPEFKPSFPCYSYLKGVWHACQTQLALPSFPCSQSNLPLSLHLPLTIRSHHVQFFYAPYMISGSLLCCKWQHCAILGT